jgi:hypothetical protein
MESSLKNEIDFSPSSIESITLLHIVFEASFHPPVPLDEMKLGGGILLASGLHAEVKTTNFLSWGISTNHPCDMC